MLVNAIDNNPGQGVSRVLTVDQVFQCIDNLYSMKNYGNKIRLMRESHESARMYEMNMANNRVNLNNDGGPVPATRKFSP